MGGIIVALVAVELGDLGTDFTWSLGVGIVSLLIVVAQGSVASKRQKEYDRAANMWQRQKARWDELYYCFRDDIIFVRSEPSLHVKPDQMEIVLGQ